MAWKFDNPLQTLTTEDQNQAARDLWEGESLGGIKEDNNRLPQPVVTLLILTIITAFMITFPLWGQRPTAAIYEEYIALMDDPNVQAMSDEKAMKYIVNTVKSQGSKWAALQERHPLEMDDLRMIKDQIIELQNQSAYMQDYTVVGDKVVIANFEGNYRADGTRERHQPYWDKGYTIDIFFIVIFCVSVIIAVKRLPNYSFKPDHSKHH
ncbi:MAG: hypothetical protein GXP19_03945 [Gammaproteobacteria bacterium]|nr:hypothetical protein [Gammaproteobacteria bacterium]